MTNVGDYATVFRMQRTTSVKFHGRILEEDVEFQVPWEGRFRFKYADLDEAGEIVAITGWGGPSGHGSWRTFAPERIKRVKRAKNTVR